MSKRRRYEHKPPKRTVVLGSGRGFQYMQRLHPDVAAFFELCLDMDADQERIRRVIEADTERMVRVMTYRRMWT